MGSHLQQMTGLTFSTVSKQESELWVDNNLVMSSKLGLVGNDQLEQELHFSFAIWD